MHLFVITFWMQPCPAGFYCPNKGELPKECPLGYYSNATGSVVCYICPEGHRCEMASSKPIPCTTGYYSSAGNITCSPCPAGHQCVNGAAPTQCAIGSWLLHFANTWFDWLIWQQPVLWGGYSIRNNELYRIKP